MRYSSPAEREALIVRQFRKYQAYFAEQGVSRRQFLRMIAAGSAATTVLPILVACGEATDDEVDDAIGAEDPDDTDLDDTVDDDEAEPDDDEVDEPDEADDADEPDDVDDVEDDDAPDDATAGGTILIGTLGEAQTINPLLTNESEGQWRVKMMFEEFIKLDPESLEPVPNIADDWEPSEDGREYTFTLRDDVVFSDGEPLTAEDIEFTFYALLAPETASPFLPRFDVIEGAADYNAGDADEISGIEVVDDHTIVLTLAEPNAAFISNLRFLRPIPKHLLEDAEDFTNDPFFQEPVGAGPFMFESWTTGQDFVAVRNPHYWKEDQPYLDGFTHRTIADAQTLAIALETQEIEGSNYAAPSEAERLEEAGLVVLTRPRSLPDDGWAFSAVNNENLADPRVRQAIALAIDIEAYTEDFLLGLGAPAIGPVAPANWAYNDNLEQYPYDPDRARELLEEAGVGEFSVRVTTNAGNVFREDWVTFTQAELAEVGITVEPDIKEWSQVVEEGTQGTFEMICPVWSASLIDPDELSLTLMTDAARNVYGYSNPEVDELFLQGRAETDQEARIEIYHQVQEILWDELPIYWAWYRPFIHVTTEDFDGYGNSVLGFFQELQEWRRTT
jgi:peptide/nickel transport system substrate-binding protein